MELPDPLKWIIGMTYNTDATGLPESATRLQLRVPFVHQQHVNLCGDAAALMIAKFWQLDTLVDTSRNPRGAFEGSMVGEHKHISSFGVLNWKREDGPAAAHRWTAAELRDRLSTHGPLACALSHSLTLPVVNVTVAQWGHWIVLIGVDTNLQSLSYHDPWRGQYRIMSLADFNFQFDWDDGGEMFRLAGINNDPEC